jgi:(p)ppGpp synthase/HD superfamily hydrolase
MKFSVEKRVNKYRKTGCEFALNIQFENSNKWNICAWEKKPSKETLLETIEIVKRSMDVVLHNITSTINKPDLSVEEIYWTVN